jgi:hypothetical protein
LLRRTAGAAVIVAQCSPRHFARVEHFVEHPIERSVRNGITLLGGRDRLRHDLEVAAADVAHEVVDEPFDFALCRRCQLRLDARDQRVGPSVHFG